MPLLLDTLHTAAEGKFSTAGRLSHGSHHPCSPGMIHPGNDQREAPEGPGACEAKARRVQGDREVKCI